MDEPTLVGVAHAGYRRIPTRLDRILYAPAASDWILAAYFFTVLVELTRARPSVPRDTYLVFTFLILVAFIAGVYLYRLRIETLRRSGYAALLGYHLLPVAAILLFYFNLRPILPIINPSLFDESLYRLDLRIFGCEPTLLIEDWSTIPVVEWFSFFYYSYFFLIASFIFVQIVAVDEDERLSHFAMGILFIVCVGHFVYTLVPGFGPYEYLAHDFHAPLRGGVFYGLVLQAVSGAGPLRDIFPSLHTALPVFCALFAWRYYPRLALLVSFFAGNIMVATVVLRWHYATDVLAGMALSLAAFYLGPRIVEAYQGRRADVGLASLRRW